MTFVPIVWATAVPITSGPATLNRSSAAATRGVIRRPEVNDAIRLPPSLKPETRPNKPAAASGATAARLTTRGRRSCPSRLGKSDDLSTIVDVDPGRRGIGRQAGHCAHVAANRVDEAGTHRRAYLSHGQHPTGRSALERGVVGIEEVEGVGLCRRLGHGLGQLDRPLPPSVKWWQTAERTPISSAS